MNSLADFLTVNTGRLVSLAELQAPNLQVALRAYFFGCIPPSPDIVQRVADLLYTTHRTDAPTAWMVDAWLHRASCAEREEVVRALCGNI